VFVGRFNQNACFLLAVASKISIVFVFWPAGIDAAEDFFCGDDGVGDGGVGGGAGFEVELSEAAPKSPPFELRRMGHPRGWKRR